MNLQEYWNTVQLPDHVQKAMEERWARLHREGRYRITILGDPPIWREIPTIAETITRLDAAIANVRRFA